MNLVRTIKKNTRSIVSAAAESAQPATSHWPPAYLRPHLLSLNIKIKLLVASYGCFENALDALDPDGVSFGNLEILLPLRLNASIPAGGPLRG